MKKIARNEAASMPPITTLPSTRREMAPAPVAVHNGTHPKRNANDVIRIGRNRSFAPVSAASIRVAPLSYSILANSTIRMAFFAESPINMTRPICA